MPGANMARLFVDGYSERQAKMRIFLRPGILIVVDQSGLRTSIQEYPDADFAGP
jgi:hypothetical protein